MSPVLIGIVQFGGVDGVPVAPSPFATASCVLSSANPLSELVALVGQGLLEAAVERQAPVPEASASGVLLASASEPPPESWRVLRRSSDTNPPLPCTLHLRDLRAGGRRQCADNRHGHQADGGDSDATPHLVTPSVRPSPPMRMATPLLLRIETGEFGEPCAGL